MISSHRDIIWLKYPKFFLWNSPNLPVEGSVVAPKIWAILIHLILQVYM